MKLSLAACTVRVQAVMPSSSPVRLFHTPPKLMNNTHEPTLGVRDANGQPDGKGLNIHVTGIKELKTELGDAGWPIETPRKHRGESGNKIIEQVNNLQLYQPHGELPRESGYVSDVRIDRRPRPEVEKLCSNSEYYRSTERLKGYCQFILSAAGQSAAKVRSTALVGGGLGGFGFGR